MKKNSLLLFVACIFCLTGSLRIEADQIEHAQWTVIGAGPTGTMCVGLILDSGVPANEIVWIDRDGFGVGRMGKYYKNVPGNGRVEQYIAFIQMCNTFKNIKSEAIDHLYSLAPTHAPALQVLTEPLQDITDHLRTHVRSYEAAMTGLDLHDNQWQIQTTAGSFVSDNVVLATGAKPKTIEYEGITQIPLDQALDKSLLADLITEHDCVGVIGSGHSAILILKYLSELSVNRVVHFFKKPIVYPVHTRIGIAWQEAGLKGDVAQWAKTVLETNPPKNMLRVFNTPQAMEDLLPQCTKIIYAAGFERNDLPPINGDCSIYANYNRNSGLIAPHLYGVGIAFPQEKVDPLGNVELLVGLPYVTFDGLIEALNPVSTGQTTSKPDNK